MLSSSVVDRWFDGPGSYVGKSHVEVGRLGAAVDLEHLAGYVRPGLRRQVDDSSSDVLGVTDAPEWRARLHCLAQCGGLHHDVEGGGGHRPHGDGVDPDA